MEQSWKKLERAYVTEAVAAAANEMHALRAERENRPGAARTFRALAMARHTHASRALMLLRGRIGDTDTNLEDTLQDLRGWIDEYREGVAIAGEEGATPVEAALSQFLKTAMNHKALAEKADSLSETGLHVCRICGFVAQGDTAPERCPVCDAVRERFQTVD